MATYCVKTRTAPSSASTVPISSSSRSSFSERPDRLGVGLLEEVGRVVADLLEPGEQLEHQAATGVLVGLLDAAHAVADVGLVEHDLLAGQAEEVVGLGLGRQLGGDARGRTCAGAAGTARSGRRTAAPWSARRPASIGAAHTLRKALRLPRSPGIAQSRIAHSSVRLFSTGVPVSATRAALGIVRSAREVEDCAFFTCCASSATTRSHRDLGQRSPRRGASCRTSSARTRHRCDPSSERVRRRARGTAPWSAGRDAGREPPDLGLPVAEERRRADHERRPPARDGRGAVQVQRDHLHRLARAPCRRPGRRRARGR